MLAIYFADLLNNDSGLLPSDLLPPADQDYLFVLTLPLLKKHRKLSRISRSTNLLVWIVLLLRKLSRWAARLWLTPYTYFVLKYLHHILLQTSGSPMSLFPCQREGTSTSLPTIEVFLDVNCCKGVQQDPELPRIGTMNIQF